MCVTGDPTGIIAPLGLSQGLLVALPLGGSGLDLVLYLRGFEAIGSNSCKPRRDTIRV